MNKLKKVDSIMYYVKDLEVSTKFYEELGLKRVWTDKRRNMVGFIFPESDSEVVIHTNPEITNPTFSFLVDNVDRFCDEYRNKKYKVAFGPIEVRTGKFAILSDPDGNEIPIIDLTKFGNKPQYDKEVNRRL